MSVETVAAVAAALLAGIGMMFGAMRWLVWRTDAIAEKVVDRADRIMADVRTDFDRLSRRMDELHNQERDDRHALGNRVHDTITREAESLRELVAATDVALRTEVREAERRCMEALARHKIEDARRNGRRFSADEAGELLTPGTAK